VGESDPTRLRSGEPIADAFARLDEAPQAVLVNCSSPEAVTAAMPALRATGRPFGGYANGFTPFERGHLLGTTVESLNHRTDLGPEPYALHAMRWAAAGAAIVGGCCETGPDHIAALARALHDAGYETTGDLP
jgi:homocysteine S-methyltransferase